MSDAQAIMPIADTQREVAEQPTVVDRVLTSLQDQVSELAAILIERNVQRLFLLGSGDSWFAGVATRMALEHYSGLPTEPIQAYEYAAYGHPGVDAQAAVIVISSSGRPTTTWDALDRALATSAYVIGITDKQYDGNPFIEKPHIALVPGAVKLGLPTQTTTATMALLIDLAIALGQANGYLSSNQAGDFADRLRTIPDQMDTVLRQSEPIAIKLASALLGQRVYTLVGGGPSLGVAYTGSALLAEGPQEVGLPLAVEEFHHALRYGAIAQREPVIIIAPDGLVNSRNLDTAKSMRNWNAHIIAIVTDEDTAITPLAGTVFKLPSIPEPMSPLLTLLPLHQLSIQLALQKMATGYQRPSEVP